ncbi:MAG: amidase [Rubrivivax sp.]|nr:amidase [Rubrivivax sp.]
MQDLCLLPAHELTRRLRRREISATDLLQHHLDRMARLNPAINAVVVTQPEVALARARAADEALARGEVWGPLHGLPMTVKESFDVPGLPTTWGLEAFRDNLATRHAVAVQRLLNAGAVVYGKTNVPAALADWQSFNPIYGTCGNPWDTSRTPGGSSGGASAALAAGLTPLELGSDIGSSIRNPAHYCGVWGHKPTWGVVPLEGHQLPGDVCPDSTDIAVAGPLARSAHDLTLALDVLASPLTVFGPLGRTPAVWRDHGLPARQLRVAVMTDDAQAPVDASVRRAMEDLVDFLQRSGVQVSTDARPIKSEDAWRLYIPLVRSALAGHMSEAEFADALQRAEAGPGGPTDFPRLHWRSLTMTHRDWLRLDEERHALRQQWAAFFEHWDVLIQPVAATAAFPHDQQGFRWERFIQVNGQPQAHTTQLFWAGYSGQFGLPSTAVPIGQSPEGLPIGAQLIAAPFADPVSLRLARWLETEYRGFVAPPMALA